MKMLKTGLIVLTLAMLSCTEKKEVEKLQYPCTLSTLTPGCEYRVDEFKLGTRTIRLLNHLDACPNHPDRNNIIDSQRLHH